MSRVAIDSELLVRLDEIASRATLSNTTELLSGEMKPTTYLFLCSLACKSEREYNEVKERLGKGEPLGTDFEERVALVTRAFCVGHDWVSNNWSLWKK